MRRSAGQIIRDIRLLAIDGCFRAGVLIYAHTPILAFPLEEGRDKRS